MGLKLKKGRVMSEKISVLLNRRVPSNSRGALRYEFRDLVIKGVGDGLNIGYVSMRVSPADERLNRFRKCMDGLREDVSKGESSRLKELFGCKGCPIAATYANGESPIGFSIGSELSPDDNYSTWIGANSCPAILAMLEMVTVGEITSKYALSRLITEAPCMNKAQRFAKVDTSE